MIRDHNRLKGVFSFIFCGLLIIEFLAGPYHLQQHSQEHPSLQHLSSPTDSARQGHFETGPEWAGFSHHELESFRHWDDFACLICIHFKLYGSILKLVSHDQGSSSFRRESQQLFNLFPRLSQYLTFLTVISSRGPPFFINS